MSPRVMDTTPREDGHILIELYDLCERSGRRYLDVKAAAEELVEADSVVDVAAILCRLLEYTPHEVVINAAAVKDARDAIKVAQTVLAGIDRRLDKHVTLDVEIEMHKPARARRPWPKRPCPVCEEPTTNQGMWKHCEARHGWTREQYREWSERDRERAVA